MSIHSTHIYTHKNKIKQNINKTKKQKKTWMNTLWFISFGWLFGLLHLIVGIIGLPFHILCLPVGMLHLRLAYATVAPYGVVWAQKTWKPSECWLGGCMSNNNENTEQNAANNLHNHNYQIRNSNVQLEAGTFYQHN